MKRSNIIEARRAKVSPEVRRRVDLSFLIVDRIHSILEEKGIRKRITSSERKVSFESRGKET